MLAQYKKMSAAKSKRTAPKPKSKAKTGQEAHSPIEDEPRSTRARNKPKPNTTTSGRGMAGDEQMTDHDDDNGGAEDDATNKPAKSKRTAKPKSKTNGHDKRSPVEDEAKSTRMGPKSKSKAAMHRGRGERPEAEAILDHKDENGNVLYLVHWKDTDEETWEDGRDLQW